MIPFKNLSVQENEVLLKFPAYISLLAANSDHSLDKEEKKSAIKFAHIKTFSCHPLFAEFYKEAEKVLEKNIEQLEKELPEETHKREAAIKAELLKIEKIAYKLGENHTALMHKSMKSFKEHVSKAHHNVLVDFIFPLSIHGLTDK